MDDKIDKILLQYHAEQRQGLNELAGNGTADEQLKQSLLQLLSSEREEAEIALARKVLGVSSMVHKQKGVTQSMRLKHLTKEMLKIIPDTLGVIEDATPSSEEREQP